MDDDDDGGSVRIVHRQTPVRGGGLERSVGIKRKFNYTNFDQRDMIIIFYPHSFHIFIYLLLLEYFVCG